MVGLLAGLLNARKSGLGCDVDVSLLDSAVSMLNYVAIWTLNRDYSPQRLPDSAHPTLYPAQVFETADSYIVVLCFKEKFWSALTKLIEAPELAGDTRFATFEERYQHRDILIADLKKRFLGRSTDSWLALLRGRVPCAPVKSVEQALQDPQVLARKMLIEVEHPSFGPLRQVDTAIKVAGRSNPGRPAPALGADTESVLRELLGHTTADIEELRIVGAI